MPHAAVPRVAHGGSVAGWSVQHQCGTRQHLDAGDKLVSHFTQASIRNKSYLESHSCISGIQGIGPGFGSHMHPSGADAALV